MRSSGGARGRPACSAPTCPVEHGGPGGDFGFECVVYEELLHAGFACFGKGVHEIATHYVLDYGSDEQRAGAGCRAWSRGELVGAIAHDRARRGLRPARHHDLRRARRRSLRRQRHQDVHHERPARDLICLVVRTDADAGSQGYTLLHGRDRGPRGLHARPAAAQARPARAGHVRAALRGLPRAGRGEPRRGQGPLPADGAAAVRAHDRRRHGDRGARARRSPTRSPTRASATPSASR